MAIYITAFLNQLESTGAISEKQLQYLSSPQEQRPRSLYILSKIHKETICCTISNVVPPERPYTRAGGRAKSASLNPINIQLFLTMQHSILISLSDVLDLHFERS